MISRQVLIVATLTVSLIGISGCSRVAQNSIENAGESTGSAEQTTERAMQNGTTAHGGQALPASWPSDIPVFPDAFIDVVNESNSATEGPKYLLLFTTPASVSDVSTFYIESLARHGWNKDSDLQSSEGALMGFSKGDMLMTLTSGVADDKGSTSVSLAVGRK